MKPIFGLQVFDEFKLKRMLLCGIHFACFKHVTRVPEPTRLFTVIGPAVIKELPVLGGRLDLQGAELLKQTPAQLRSLRGARMGMVP